MPFGMPEASFWCPGKAFWNSVSPWRPCEQQEGRRCRHRDSGAILGRNLNTIVERESQHPLFVKLLVVMSCELEPGRLEFPGLGFLGCCKRPAIEHIFVSIMLASIL